MAGRGRSSMFVFRMPFVDYSTYYRIITVLRKYNLPVRVVTQATTLRNVLKAPAPAIKECKMVIRFMFLAKHNLPANLQ